ncbi:A disintegrin and metalloproteinase with thrombospondin motifs 20 [Chionoecetes opilio]|uniref:A disintegrin and metalloproteinase with thrombospondin motifs 20 n=1 Tax=Chionoecetes opilio TaxID=41210 RepID=A0A8J4YA71_CHIOP|nr:A disintegrin and metalloproteinase with thrombospondin motifs 20 [Chionoecetes opilio]
MGPKWTVSLIFRDVSVGHRLDVSVVEIIKETRQFYSLKQYQQDNNSEVPGRSAEEILKTFCKWQQHHLKRAPLHPRRYDTALLLTRENICRNPWTKSCDTLGLAELGTMCSRHSSCAIVQDNGLSAAFTIAHELGHLLNMPHDNDDKCGLLTTSQKGGAGVEGDSKAGQTMNVMSRMLDHNTLPGGRSPEWPTCKRLWCTTSADEKEGCRTQHMPWADGTECGEELWCLKGQCVERDRAVTRKVHGHWGEWLPWSECSRTCGVGVRSSTRRCDSPLPRYGGNYCTGERVRYESCIGKPCPAGTLDFRTKQCHSFNNKNFGLTDIPEEVVWVPKYAGRNTVVSSSPVFNRPPTAYYKLAGQRWKDGNIVWSGHPLTSYACGVCHGDNSTCEVTAGSFHEAFPYGYSDVVEIPEGAAMIEVTQRAYHGLPTDDNYLALVDGQTGEYLLNGGSVVTPFQQDGGHRGHAAAVQWLQRHHGAHQRHNPPQQKLLVQILSVGDLNPPHIEFSYIKSTLYHDPNYYWQLDDWSLCSHTCDGDRERVAYCVRAADGVRVRDPLCPDHQRPSTQREPCSSTCPVHWEYTDWSKCAVREGGSECVRRREVGGCVTAGGYQVQVHLCEAENTYEVDMCSPINLAINPPHYLATLMLQ